MWSKNLIRNHLVLIKLLLLLLLLLHLLLHRRLDDILSRLNESLSDGDSVFVDEYHLLKSSGCRGGGIGRRRGSAASAAVE